MTQGDTSASQNQAPAEMTRQAYLDAMKKAQSEGNVKEIERLRALRLQAMKK